MKRFFSLLLCIVCTLCHGVVMRHDVLPQNYLVDTRPGYLIDMPHEGHGVLIHPQWIITVAHTIFYDYTGKS